MTQTIEETDRYQYEQGWNDKPLPNSAQIKVPEPDSYIPGEPRIWTRGQVQVMLEQIVSQWPEGYSYTPIGSNSQCAYLQGEDETPYGCFADYAYTQKPSCLIGQLMASLGYHPGADNNTNGVGAVTPFLKRFSDAAIEYMKLVQAFQDYKDSPITWKACVWAAAQAMVNAHPQVSDHDNTWIRMARATTEE